MYLVLFLCFLFHTFLPWSMHVDMKPTLFFVQTYSFTKECPGLGQPRSGNSLLEKK